MPERFAPGTTLYLDEGHTTPAHALVLGEVLGSGAHGVTYRAESIGQQGALACKVALHPADSFRHEADVLQEFAGHPNIVELKAYGQGSVRRSDGRRQWRGDTLLMEHGGTSQYFAGARGNKVD